MSARLEVLVPGPLLSIQDLGRPGLRRYGVPTSGALDPGAARLANALAGNAEGAAVLEFFVAGPTLRALDDAVHLSCVGDFRVEHDHGGIIRRLPSWRSVVLQAGDTLRLGPLLAGRVGYVGVAGLDIPPVLGSRATYTRASFGGFHGRPLHSGDILPLRRLDAESMPADVVPRVLLEPPRAETGPIRVVPGPQDDYFSAATLERFLAEEFVVTRESDRMGIRLCGPALAHARGADIISDATVPGAIQVPGNGQPIVLLADGQTAGGYPKIATVISSDLPRLATMAAETRVRFTAVDVAQAEALARDRERQIRAMLASIGTLGLEDGIDPQAIYCQNLVSGVVNAVAPD